MELVALLDITESDPFHSDICFPHLVEMSFASPYSREFDSWCVAYCTCCVARVPSGFFLFTCQKRQKSSKVERRDGSTTQIPARVPGQRVLEFIFHEAPKRLRMVSVSLQFV